MWYEFGLIVKSYLEELFIDFVFGQLVWFEVIFF